MTSSLQITPASQNPEFADDEARIRTSVKVSFTPGARTLCAIGVALGPISGQRVIRETLRLREERHHTREAMLEEQPGAESSRRIWLTSRHV